MYGNQAEGCVGGVAMPGVSAAVAIGLTGTGAGLVLYVGAVT